MPEVKVERGSTAKLSKVEGDLKVGKGAKIDAAGGKLVTVSGGAFFEGDAEIDCDFDCDSMMVERGALSVAGDLTVAKGIDVAHTLRVAGTISADGIEVGGKMYAGSVLCEHSVRAGGVVEVTRTLEAESVDVGGKVLVRGQVKLKDLGVGGKAEVGGGTIAGRTRVGGVFASAAPLEFGELQVYGKCALPADCKGKKLSTFGKLTVAGGMTCEQVDVGGMTEVQGDLAAAGVLVNGRLSVSGSISVKGLLEINGSGEVAGEFRGTDLRVGGRFKALKALVGNQADIAGEVETKLGLKGTTILVRSGSRSKGSLVGGNVELGKSGFVAANWAANWAGQSIAVRAIGRMTTADDIYGKEVILRPNSRCRRIFAEKVELGEGCIVDQVNYTIEMRRSGSRVFLTNPPENVAALPDFPL